jgi:plastocyanin
MRRRNIIGAAALAGILAAAAVPALGASTHKKTINVIDDAFTPPRATVRKNTIVAWKWSANNYQEHNVKLVSAPHGVKKFTSPSGTTGITFRKRLTKPGTYKFVCTYHESVMKLTVKVRH